MSELVTDEMKIRAAKNEWGKEFTLGVGDEAKQFEIKDLKYFDYVEFIQLAKPLITMAMNGIVMGNEGGEVTVNFNPEAVDMDEMLALSGKELPRMAWLICKQSHPKITEVAVAELGRRPQRLLEVVLLQILHNNMIQEFGSFFSRLTALVSALVPDMTESAPALTTEETP